MTDEEIISLYFDRSEEAIAATQRKYDGYCRSILSRLLGSSRDVEEALSDTWLQAWMSIPPNRPENLRLYLAKIGRNLALNRLREDGVDLSLMWHLDNYCFRLAFSYDPGLSDQELLDYYRSVQPMPDFTDHLTE